MAAETPDKPADKPSPAPKPAPKTGDSSTAPKPGAETAENTPPTPEPREGQREGVNPLLDNRTGDQAPDLDAPPKPQQLHGGLPGDTTDYEDPPSGERTDPTRAEGPHGRGPQSGPSSED